MPPLVMVKVPPCISSIVSVAVAGALANVGDRLLDLGERQAVGVAHHRHDQALVGADRDADVVVVLVDDVGAVDLGVDRRDLLQRLDARLHEEAHEAELDAVLLLEEVAVSVRSAITALMSTSLKVVSMAAVFCASLRRRAMVWRSRDMRTRSSRAASSAGDGARTVTGVGTAGRGRGDGGKRVGLGDAAVLAGTGERLPGRCSSRSGSSAAGDAPFAAARRAAAWPVTASVAA